MRCSKAKRYISLQLDGELRPQHQPKLDKHLAKCSACRSWQAEEQQLQLVLSARPSADLPAWVHARIMDSVHRLDHKRPSLARKFRLATAGAALAVVLSTWGGMQIGIKSFNNINSTKDSSVAAISANFGENTLLENYLVIGDSYE